MVCQICGAKSKFYPLCTKHNNMRETGEVVKCEKCKKWYLVSKGCLKCTQGSDDEKGDILFVSDDQTAPRIKEMLDRAKDSVLIASPWIWGIENIVQRLEGLRKKKVDISILTRRSGKTDAKHEKTVDMVRGFGCVIDFIDELHAKMVLVDETELYIGSANLVETSLERNKEAGIWTNNPATVADAKNYLAEASIESFKKRSRK